MNLPPLPTVVADPSPDLAPSGRTETISDGVFAIAITLLVLINIAILLGICLTPFPNALLANALGTGLSSEAAKVAAGAYGLVFMATTVAWILIWERLSRRPELLRPPYTAAWARRERYRGAFGATIYAGGIGIAWLSPLVAMGLFTFLALFYALTARGFAPDP
jgi:uncharacterized membrane protein